MDKQNSGPVPIYLERIDRANNARRFYYAFVGPTLVGPICVVRIHGRLGVWQRTLSPLIFDDEADAVQWIERQRQRKLRRGCVASAPTTEQGVQPNGQS